MLDINLKPENGKNLKIVLAKGYKKKRGDIQLPWISPRNVSGYFSTWRIEE